MKLKNYTPAGNQIICGIRQHNKIGLVISPEAQIDKIVEVLKVGPLCKDAKAGDFVNLDDRGYLQMAMENSEGKEVPVILATEFNIIGYYTPDPDEKQFYVAVKKPSGFAGNDEVRELNIIDNPGIEKAPYLAEEEANKKLFTP
jgi:hypothetical protein